MRKNGPNDTEIPDPLRSVENSATESIPCKADFGGRAFPTKAPLNLIGGYSWSDATSVDPKLITQNPENGNRRAGARQFAPTAGSWQGPVVSTLQAAPTRPSAKQVAARHREIDRRYKRARPPVDQSKLIAGVRRNEIERLIQHRHDVLPDTDDRDWYLKLWGWHNTRSAHQHEDLKALGRRLGVELPDAEVATTVAYVNRKPRRFSADRQATNVDRG